MELKHDWRVFNSVLFPQDVWGSDQSVVQPRMVLVENQDRIVEGTVSTGASFEDQGLESPALSKDRLDSLALKYRVSQTYVVAAKDMQEGITQASDLGMNYYQQLQFIRNKLAEPKGGTSKKAGTRKEPVFMVSRKHFLLDFLAGPAARFLPRSYHFLVFIDYSTGFEFKYKALILHVNQGNIDQFFEPDFSSLHENRLEEWNKSFDIIGEYLESRYLLPCFGAFIKKGPWAQCLEASAKGKNPWKSFSQALDQGSAVMYPQSLTMKSLLAAQRLMGYLKP